MVVLCGEGRVTSSTMDTPLSMHTHHHFRHQVAAVPGALWVSMARGAYSHHDHPHSPDFSTSL